VVITKKVAENVGYIINGLSIAAYFFFVFTLDCPLCRPYFTYIGFVLLVLGILLIVLSIRALSRDREGLIDWGVFGIIRHPMYVGAIVAFAAMSLFLPHWITLLLSLVNAAIVYAFTLQGDRLGIERFGSEYERYAKRVPRANVVVGLARFLRRR
jgi:protein-S-isoprenylcysteine O-methyltransferase Ste14